MLLIPNYPATLDSPHDEYSALFDDAAVRDAVGMGTRPRRSDHPALVKKNRGGEDTREKVVNSRVTNLVDTNEEDKDTMETERSQMNDHIGDS